MVKRTNFFRILCFHGENTRISRKFENLLRLAAPKRPFLIVKRTNFFRILCFHGENTRISRKIENLLRLAECSESTNAQWAKVRRKLFFLNFFFIGSPLCKFLKNVFFWQLLVILSQKYPEIHYLSTANRDKNSDAQRFPLTLNPETRAKVAEH